MKTNILIALSALSLATAALAVNEPAIIPQPQELTRLEGVFKLAPTTEIICDATARDTARILSSKLRQSTGWEFPVSDSAGTEPNGGILLTTSGATAALGAEGYELTATSKGMVIRAQTAAGLFYGAVTLVQLLPPEACSSQVASSVAWEVPCVKITDVPRFPWRGFMLDVSRHFFNKEEVKQMLNAMALHKLNTFHWHLVDDNGWRIEIKKYPKLTSVSAWRDGIGFGMDKKETTAYGPDGRYGGFYTQDDIREVVEYAARLHITIIPEIEMPGHALAALSAYPELGSGPGPFEVPLKGGVNPGIFSPAKPEAFEFLQNVLLEVFELFPSKYIHIGGDEVPKEPWKKDAACQALMKKENLKNEQELQSWFTRRMESFINAHGKTLLGWSEILEGGLAQNAAVMDWIGGAREAASSGHDVVMSPTSNCYFDYYQARATSGEPRAIGGYLPLQKAYSLEPIPSGLAADKVKHILGAQGNVWTEYIANLKHVQYMAFPRLSALAEVAWSPKSARNFEDFKLRLKRNEQRLDQMGVNYRSSALPDGAVGQKVGDWNPSQISTTPAPLEWDVTAQVKSAGAAKVNFEYSHGAHGIDIAWVVLLEDGKEIARDAHVGFTGGSPRKPVYSLTVPATKPGAHYTLRAQISGSGGNDSNGSVFWDLKPMTK